MQTMQVFSEPDGYPFGLIKNETTGNWNVIYQAEGEIKSDIEISVTPDTELLTNKVILMVRIKASEGIASYVDADNATKTYVSGTTETTETFTVTANGEYTFSAVDINGKTDTYTIVVSNIISDLISLTAIPANKPTQSVTVTANWPSGITNEEKLISTDSGITWLTYTKELSIEKNGIVEAILSVDGKTISSGSITVSNIDRLPPNAFSFNIGEIKGTSITVSGSTTDQSATDKYSCSRIKAYYFSKDGGSTWENDSSNILATSYTFSGLKVGTSYNIKMKAVDNAGNETVTETIAQSTLAIPGGADIILTPSTTEWTNQDITVSATWPSGIDGLTKQISIDNGNTWNTYTGVVTISQNTTVKARLLESETNKYGEEAKLPIENIDKIGPSAPTITGGSKTAAISRTISVSEAAVDNKDGTKGSGVAYYEYYEGKNIESSNVDISAEENVLVKATGNESIRYTQLNGDIYGSKGIVITIPDGVNIIKVYATAESVETEALREQTITISKFSWADRATSGEPASIGIRAYGEQDWEERTKYIKVTPGQTYLVSVVLDDFWETGETSACISYSASINEQTPDYDLSYISAPTSDTVATGQVGTTASEISKIFDTEFTGNVYFRAVDKVGNKGDWSNGENLNIITQWSEGVEIPVPNLVPSTTEWTNQGITVSATWPDNIDGLTKRISVDGTNNGYTYTVPVTISENGVVKAWLENTITGEKGQPATLTITNIDKIGPSAPTITGGSANQATSRTISISEESVDNKDGTEGSGILYYEYQMIATDSTEKTEILCETTTSGGITSYNYDIRSKKFNTDFTGTVRFRAVDKVGNEGEWSDEQSLNIISGPTVEPISYANEKWQVQYALEGLTTSSYIMAVNFNNVSSLFTITGTDSNYTTTYTAKCGSITQQLTADSSNWKDIATMGHNYALSNQLLLNDNVPVTVSVTIECFIKDSSGNVVSTAINEVIVNVIDSVIDLELGKVWLVLWDDNTTGSTTITIPEGVNVVEVVADIRTVEFGAGGYACTSFDGMMSADLNLQSGYAIRRALVRVTPGAQYNVSFTCSGSDSYIGGVNYIDLSTTNNLNSKTPGYDLRK